MKKMAWALAVAMLLALPAAAQANDGEVRQGVMLRAFEDLGADTPTQAAVLWGRGVAQRNGALQYAMLSQALKKDYVNALTNSFPNWVTGVSSPWVDAYALELLRYEHDDTATARMSFETATSDGPYQRYQATLRLIKEPPYWRIDRVDEDKELSVYTGW